MGERAEDEFLRCGFEEGAEKGEMAGAGDRPGLRRHGSATTGTMVGLGFRRGFDAMSRGDWPR